MKFGRLGFFTLRPEQKQPWIAITSGEKSPAVEWSRGTRGGYGMYQERAPREKVCLAAKLLEKAGVEIHYETSRKVMKQSPSNMRSRWTPPKQAVAEDLLTELGNNRGRIVQFPGGSQSG